MRIPMIALSLLLACLSSCKKEKNYTNEMFWADVLNSNDNNYYNNCSVQPTVLNPGTHQVTLSQGQEYWFDFTSRDFVDTLKQYRVTVQEQPGQDVKAVYMNCLRNHGISHPIPKFTMGTDYLVDSGNTGSLEAYTVETRAALHSGQFAVVLKSVTGSGTVDLTIPTGHL